MLEQPTVSLALGNDGMVHAFRETDDGEPAGLAACGNGVGYASLPGDDDLVCERCEALLIAWAQGG